MSSHTAKDGSPAPRDPIDSLESNFKAVVDYLTSHARSPDAEASTAKPSDAPVSSFRAKAGALIKKYPLAAIGAAFGFGYIVMRMVRR